ncbi:MAG TPA: calcium-binding protein [Azospirillaceae bacterium]|nr:calcium-binding protein [Azospirillaceae bacterium]
MVGVLRIGTRINDWLESGYDGDTIFGLEGNDTVFSNLGNDSVVGGAGNDWIFGYGGHDKLFGSTGNDLLHGDDGYDLIDGGAGNDTINGGSGHDTLIGGGGTDAIDGGDGMDTLALDGRQSSYRITPQADGALRVIGTGSTIVVQKVEYLLFEYGTDRAAVVSTQTLRPVAFNQTSIGAWPGGGGRRRAAVKEGAGLTALLLERYQQSRPLVMAAGSAGSVVARLSGAGGGTELLSGASSVAGRSVVR